LTRILTTELAGILTSELAGETVTLAGWLHRRRLLKSVAFAVLRDRSGLGQAVFRDPALRQVLESLPEETVVTLTGRAVASPAAPHGVELVDPQIGTPSGQAEPVPFELWRPELTAGLPAILDAAAVTRRHLGTRTALKAAADAVRGFRSTLDALDFTEIHTPKLVAAATEGGANVFAVDYFGRPAYLAQSPQLYKQLMVGVFERVYEVGPVFRAEPHDTGRHLAQYTSLDVELGFIADHHDVMAVARDTVAGMVEAIGDGPAVPEAIPEVHFADAMELVGGDTGEDLSGEPDLAPPHERWLGEWARREYGSDFLFVTGYPTRKRAFYTHPEPARPEYSNSFDLLFRGLEMISGGQRLHRHGDYLAALGDRGLPVEPLRSYVDAFRYGIPPHGGFAIGLERFVSALLGKGNVREVTAFPRDRRRLTP
jgi:nondiscriminating aspartyl-tRNA synthetase